MGDLEEWSANGNEAIHITLKHRNRKHDETFHPTFTYPIFGDEESIFGYQDLKIKLDYAADTLVLSHKITWNKQYEQVGDTKAADIDELLQDFLPTTGETAKQSNSGHSTHFTPPGELVHQYEANGRRFGIWQTPLAAKEASRLIENMQIFVTFFIEGGTFLELDDPDWTVDRWTVFFLYAIDDPAENHSPPSYSFVGYSTTYRLFFFDADYSSSFSLTASSPFPSDVSLSTHLPCRQRISQFLILPPHEHSGHGSHLYSTMLRTFFANSTIHEITVEDPNESFDDLRDVNDLLRLRANLPPFTTLTIPTTAALPALRATPLPTATLLPPDLIAAIRKSSKIAPRQLDRLIEMQLLSAIPAANRSPSRLTRKDKSSNVHDRAYYFWRLLVKQRLYKHNVDALAQLDLEERVDKLEETLTGVEADYKRILDKVERRAAKGGTAVAVGGTDGGAKGEVGRSASNTRGTKRKKVLDDDDNEDR